MGKPRKTHVYKVCGDIVKILIRCRDGSKHIILIDTHDVHILENYRLMMNPRIQIGKFYVSAYGFGHYTQLHRLILKPESLAFDVDHINGNSLDNRRCNLRICTRKENSQNLNELQTNNSSGIMGVSWHKHRKAWVARVGVDRKRIQLGYFQNIKDAEQAAIAGRIKYMPFSKEARKAQANQ